MTKTIDNYKKQTESTSKKLDINFSQLMNDLELENKKLKEEVEDLKKTENIIDGGKNITERLTSIKEKIDGQIRGYYKFTIYDFQELITLI
jgi:hypothetical protein